MCPKRFQLLKLFELVGIFTAVDLSKRNPLIVLTGLKFLSIKWLQLV